MVPFEHMTDQASKNPVSEASNCQACKTKKAEWTVLMILHTVLMCDSCCERALVDGKVIEAGVL